MQWHQKKNKLDFEKRDFFCKKKKFENPFFKHKQKNPIQLPSFFCSWRVKFFIFEILILFIGLFAFFCFSPIFQIGDINVDGLIRINNTEIKNIAWEQTTTKRFLLGKQNNIFLYNKSKLVDDLNKKYCFEKIEVEKVIPNKIIIKVHEKSNAFIWAEDGVYRYADIDGLIIEEVNPLEIKEKKYPLISNETGTRKIIGDRIDLESNYVGYIIDIFKKLQNNNEGFILDKFILDKDLNTVKLKLMLEVDGDEVNGPDIYFNVEENIDKQINKLIVIKNEKLKDDFKSKEYIDLRFGDRVYYR